MTARRDPERLTIRQAFTSDRYEVPIYQRNYAWGEEQIQALVADWLGASDAAGGGRGSEYFLGNLVVAQRVEGGTSWYEVIDGQQRLTTLYLLLCALRATRPSLLPTSWTPAHLEYTARARAERTLERIGTGAQPSDLESAPPGQLDPGIVAGFRTLHDELSRQESRLNPETVGYLLDQMVLVRVTVPDSTDLNQYFEVMNTRGEQLRPEDIVKARLLGALSAPDRSAFTLLWNACSDVDRYLQYGLTPGNQPSGLRESLFGPQWDWLRVGDFDSFRTRVEAAHAVDDDTAQPGGTFARPRSVWEAIKHHRLTPGPGEVDEDDGDPAFVSTLRFPTVLLLALAQLSGASDDDPAVDAQLDDRRLVERFSERLTSDRDASEAFVKEFAGTLLRVRFLLDGVVLRRKAGTEDDEAQWTLRRADKRTSESSDAKARVSLGYVTTFGTGLNDDGPLDLQRRILWLQSALRTTYTSPRTMHWIVDLIRSAWNATSWGDLSGEAVLRALQSHARARVLDAVTDSRGVWLDKQTGDRSAFDLQRIVYTYLDYLILTETEGRLVSPQYARAFRFRYRNSLEHFFPQHAASGLRLTTDERLNDLGNLCLVTVSANSKFSNVSPSEKVRNGTQVLPQSAKLQAMAELLRERGTWEDAEIAEHGAEMWRLLRDDVHPSLHDEGLAT